MLESNSIINDIVPASHQNRHNKDIFSTRWLIPVALFAFFTLSVVVVAVYIDQINLRLNLNYAVIYVISDLLHPTAALVIYPIITIIRNKADVLRHVQHLLN